MQLSETLKLYPTPEQEQLIVSSMHEYISAVNALLNAYICGSDIRKYTSKDVVAALPSALRNQCARDARSIVRKYEKALRAADRKRQKAKDSTKIKDPKLPILKKPCFYTNNQNFKVIDARLEFPLLINGKCKRISVKTSITERQQALLNGRKLGTMRVVMKGRKLCAQIVYEVPEGIPSGNAVMGVDLGIKCPAVSYTSDGKVRFYGNGRKNRYIRRHYAHLRRRLQTKKKQSAVARINNKEQRIMRDIDHKISRQIVDEAVRNGASTIKLERLQNIRKNASKAVKRSTRPSRKNKNRNSVHTWSFYRLASFIEYKASLVGIDVVYVDPAFTSQTCPICGAIHHATDRHYTCSCGFKGHRDVVGARNICESTKYVGVSVPDRRTA